MKRIINLDPREYEHPFDKKALDALQGTKGLDTLVKKFYEYGVEKIFNIQLTSSNLRVTQSSFPDLYSLFEEARQILNLPITPALYLVRSDELQGFTTGVDHPIIALSSAAIDSFTDEELLFIIGREIGHIKSQHVLYYEIGTILPVLSEILGAMTLGIGSIVSMGLQAALLHWQKMSEYTADRAGLLACQDATIATKALAKISGLPEKYYDSFNVDDFVTQAREFQGFDEGNYNKVIKYLSLMFGEQNWSVGRGNELFKWIDSGRYKMVLNRQTDLSKPPPLKPGIKFCPKCKLRVPESLPFCNNCGQRLL
ncbi:MAG: Zn-dependent protease with chaperone function [Saprospiraceae bacterium]|jgi:Zn-dependent protease with chaperone function